MKKKKNDFFGAFKQILLFLMLLSWAGTAYMFFKNTGSSMFNVNKYGGGGMNYLSKWGSFSISVFFTVYVVVVFLPVRKDKDK